VPARVMARRLPRGDFLCVLSLSVFYVNFSLSALGRALRPKERERRRAMGSAPPVPWHYWSLLVGIAAVRLRSWWVLAAALRGHPRFLRPVDDAWWVSMSG